MQWVPGHAGIQGNEKAYKLAKTGAKKCQPQKNVTFRTAKQIIRSNLKIEWLNKWAQGTTGRSLYKYLSAPQRNDSTKDLKRKEQTTIFRLRTGHIGLNYHINTKIDPQIPPHCNLCNHPYETTEHFLYQCPALDDIRGSLLPSNPNPENCLYASILQLKKTSEYHFMAMSRRAAVHRRLGRSITLITHHRWAFGLIRWGPLSSPLP